MENVKNIMCFDSAFELLTVYNSDLLSALDPETRHSVQCVDDFEYTHYFLINNQTVIIAEDWGNVEGNAMTPEEMLESILEYIREE